MKNLSTLFCSFCLCFVFEHLFAQSPFTFTNANSRFASATFRSGNALSVVDLDGDGMDDIARLSQGTNLYYTLQRTGQIFNHINAGSTGLGTAWAMIVGDVNNDGVRDVAVGSSSQVRLFTANSTLTNFNLSGNFPKPASFFPQNMNFADVDNNGQIDLFVCNDVAESVMYGNSGTGTFPSMTNFFSAANPGSDGSGNYGSIWTDVDNDGDIDLYIAHCRQSTGSTAPTRLDQLFINDGNNNYVLDANGARGLRNYQQTWTASFEDIDNDGDFDCLLTETDAASKLLLNDGNGYFTNITTGSGFVLDVTPYQSKMADLDNDGYVDIIISGDDVRVFRNNHDNTFTLVSGLFNSNDILSFATGDLNHDGKIDLYSSYGGVYNSPSNSINDVLWLNTTNNDNHFITFNLQGTQSSRDALGARIDIYGAWGKQTREVRAGESYGTTNSLMCHFGLGTATMVDSVVIRWPRGQITRLYNRPADQFITVIEGQCSSPDNVVTFNGPSVLCTGQTVTMSAPVGYSYLWSNGDTAQQVSVSTEGEFTVKVTDANSGCSSISKMVAVVMQPDETPTITATGPTSFCEGDSVVLQASQASNYLWSSGDTTRHIIVKEPGSYSLTIQGACAPFTSQSITVAPIPSNIASVTNVNACEGDTLQLQLQASGTGTMYWFDADTGNTILATGSSFLPLITSGTATYFVESHDTLFGISGYVGPGNNNIGGGSNFSGDQAQIFDVYKTMILKSVVVYAGSSKNRTIELRAADNSTVLQSLTVNIPQGTQTVNLNFTIAPGTGYRLGWADNSSPDLYRNNSITNPAYPYTIPGLLSVTGNTANSNNFWYAYYNWEVMELPTTCMSDRTPVTATVHPVPVVSVTGLSSQYYESDSTVILEGFPIGGTFSGVGVSGASFDPSLAGVGGPYTITYTYADSNGCDAVQSLEVTVIEDTAVNVSSNDLQHSFGVLVAPNPSHGVFELRITGEYLNEDVNIRVLNALGEVVMSDRCFASASGAARQINLEGKAKGVYYLHVAKGTERRTFKIVSQ